MILERFYPDETCQSTYMIDYEERYAQGIRGVIFDIDNTLVPHGAPADKRCIELFARLHRIGYETCLLSNNQLERVKSLADTVGARFIENAHKPARGNYLKAMELMGTDLNSTLYVGDQIFTDVWGAKRCGIPNILVAPIHPKEEIQIVLKRYLEKIVLRSYRKHGGRKS